MGVINQSSVNHSNVHFDLLVTHGVFDWIICEIIEFSGSSLSCIDPFFPIKCLSHTQKMLYLTLCDRRKKAVSCVVINGNERIEQTKMWTQTHFEWILKSDKPTSWPNFDSHCWNERSIKWSDKSTIFRKKIGFDPNITIDDFQMYPKRISNWKWQSIDQRRHFHPY